MVMVVVIVVVVEVPLIGVGAVVVDKVDVVVVELQPTPSDNRRTSLPVSAQPTTRSRSPCVSDMSCTGAPAQPRDGSTSGDGRIYQDVQMRRFNACASRSNLQNTCIMHRDPSVPAPKIS